MYRDKTAEPLQSVSPPFGGKACRHRHNDTARNLLGKPSTNPQSVFVAIATPPFPPSLSILSSVIFRKRPTLTMGYALSTELILAIIAGGTITLMTVSGLLILRCGGSRRRIAGLWVEEEDEATAKQREEKARALLQRHLDPCSKVSTIELNSMRFAPVFLLSSRFFMRFSH